jgi:DNA-directed RNA polymerase sigma subunit (sigma70/sigma32)
MCKALSSDLYCTNFKCPHNLFWEELNLDRDKIQITDRALEIRNCCCLIIHPWTLEEICDTWGLTKEVIKCSEKEAYRKLEKKIRIHRRSPLSTRALNRDILV